MVKGLLEPFSSHLTSLTLYPPGVALRPARRAILANIFSSIDALYGPATLSVSCAAALVELWVVVGFTLTLVERTGVGQGLGVRSKDQGGVEG